MEITIRLLWKAMKEEGERRKGRGEVGGGRFLVDGFPRQMDQAVKFEEDVSFFGLCSAGREGGRGGMCRPSGGFRILAYAMGWAFIRIFWDIMA